MNINKKILSVVLSAVMVAAPVSQVGQCFAANKNAVVQNIRDVKAGNTPSASILASFKEIKPVKDFEKTANAFIENPASGQVMQKCGMKYEGTLRKNEKNNRGKLVDTIFYGILREEWKNEKT